MRAGRKYRQEVRGATRRSGGKHHSWAERLEPRLLLAVNPVISIPPSEQAAILNELSSRLSGQFVSDGLELSPAATVNAYTPQYIELDTTPQLNSGGTLSPFQTSGPTGLTPSEVRNAYGISTVMFGSVQGLGQGQTIAIVDAYDYPTAASDLHAFDQAFGLPDPPSFTKVNENGGTTLPGTDPTDPLGDDWEVEEALDIEWSHAMAPDANIVLVEANSPSNSDLLQNAVATAASLPGVVAVSMSWGEAESSTETSLDSYFVTPNGHIGVTFLASTGDSGAPGEYPAYSPNVMAVGGTTLDTDSAGDYLGESGWSDGGGGISSYEGQPAYQNGVVTQSTTQRTIPDISFDANPSTGVSIYDTYDFGTTDPWIVVGGTSVASPCWAGIIAVTDQGMVAAGSTTTLNGFSQTLPILYKLPAADFHDITSGNNGYPAGPGYDLVTGIGTPVANNLIPGIVALANPAMHVTTTTPAAGSVVVGTPPTTFTLTLSNVADPSTLQLADFTVNGVVPNSAGLDPTDMIVTLNYASSPVTSQGTQTISVAGGAIDRKSDETPITAFSDTFTYTLVQLQVVSSTPNATTEAVLPFTTMTIYFNETVNPSSVSAGNLSLSTGTVTNATLLAGAMSVAYAISGITTEEFVTASIAAGALKDQYGLGGAAFSVTFATHVTSNALPTATSVEPLGSQIYQASGSALVGTTSDIEIFTISLNAGQNLTVVAHPTSSGLDPSATLLGPSSSVLGSASAPSAGEDAVIQTIPISVNGTYTIQVTGGGSTTGAFTVEALLNAAVELAEHGGAPDTTLASAQDLDGAFNVISGSSAFASVVGALNVTTNDFYSLTLTAGQVLTAAETDISGTGTPTLKLLNSSGSTLATGATNAINVNTDIDGYAAASAGVYYLEVNGAAGVGYSLVVTKNAAFSLEPHNTNATAQNITGVPAALGYIGAAAGNSLTLSASDTGWWDKSGNHTSSNLNYLTGIYYGDTLNSFYVFNLAGITEPIMAAQISAYNPGAGYGGSSSSTLGYFDVSTSISSLEASGSGETSIYNDLGSGVSYGTNTVSSADDGIDIATTLDSSAVSALNSALGGQFAIGGSLVGARGSSNRYVFADTTGSPAPQLILTLGGGPDWYALNITSTSQTIAFYTSTPGEGSGQFTDSLDPHIEIFGPTDNLVASGTKLADGRNESVTYQPTVTGTYYIEGSAQNSTQGEYVLNQGTKPTLSVPSLTLPQAPTDLVYDGTTDVTSWAVPTLQGVAGEPAPTGAVTLLYYSGSSTGGTPLASSPTGPGMFTVQASYAGDSNYEPVVSNAVTFTIYPAGITLGAGGQYTFGATSGAQFIDVASGTVTFTEDLSSELSNYTLTIGNGATVVLASNQNVGQLQLNGSGTLDLGTHSVMINYGSGSDPKATILQYLSSGSNGGRWNGNGIISSIAADNSNYGVGYSDGADGIAPGLSSGQIEITYAQYGDITLQGEVNAADFHILAGYFGSIVTGGWEYGDFTYSGSVNAQDFSLLAANLGQTESGENISTAQNSPAAQPQVDPIAAVNIVAITAPAPAPTAVSNSATDAAPDKPKASAKQKPSSVANPVAAVDASASSDAMSQLKASDQVGKILGER